MNVLCLGKFDALHRGHQALAAHAARMCPPGGQVRLLHFSGMAEALGWPARLPLVAPADRQRILSRWPATPTEIELPFAAIRDLDASGFLSLIRERFAATAIVIGEDFRGGRGRSADAAAFASAGVAIGVEVATVPAVADQGGVVSSTRVRAALAVGDLPAVASLLGRNQRVLGVVERGDGRGHRIGIPTANLGQRTNQEPGNGVYAGWAYMGGAGTRGIAAAINIGHVPTAGGGRKLTVEAHLIDWQGDCYGAHLSLELVHRLRDEQTFANFPDLVAHIQRDIAKAKKILRGEFLIEQEASEM